MFRLAVLAGSICAFFVSAHSYYSAIKLTRDPDATERIVTWGPGAPTSAFTDDTRRYRLRMRWSSGLGLLLFLAWEYLTVTK